MNSYSRRILLTRCSEHVAGDPWKLLVAVALLNKTARVQAVPVFFSLIEEWPDARALAQGRMPCSRAQLPLTVYCQHLRVQWKHASDTWA